MRLRLRVIKPARVQWSQWKWSFLLVFTELKLKISVKTVADSDALVVSGHVEALDVM